MDAELRLPGSPTAAVRALLFDLDDTLYDRARAFRAWATAFVAAYLVGWDETSRYGAVETLGRLGCAWLLCPCGVLCPGSGSTMAAFR